MQRSETLKQARNILLRLHKELLDRERELYESIHGRMGAGQFLNVLLEDPDLAWLRVFSTLIVEIDEMFDLSDGYSEDMAGSLLDKVAQLVEMRLEDSDFNAKYRSSLQQSVDAAGLHSQLKGLLED